MEDGKFISYYTENLLLIAIVNQWLCVSSGG